jgi:hypothetical protein
MLSFVPLAATAAVATAAVAMPSGRARLKELWAEREAAERAATDAGRQYALALRRREQGADLADFDAIEAAWNSACDAMTDAEERVADAIAALPGHIL